jgi:hypothetical protein
MSIKYAHSIAQLQSYASGDISERCNGQRLGGRVFRAGPRRGQV